MLFEKDKYYNYIVKLEKRINYYYVLLIGITTIIGAITYYIKGMIIGAIIGLIIANYVTLKIKIQIQKMKIDIDIYNKIERL